MKSTLRALFCFSLYAALLVACSKDDTAAPPTTTKKGTVCVANQTVFCRCGPETGKAAGTEGFQTCARDGKSFGECGPCIADEDVDPPDVPPVSCGNNIREGSEECDDGNQVDTDGCTHFCKYAVCGDKFVQTGKEDCDDGNTTAGDGCSPACKTEDTSNPCKDAGLECPTEGLGECRKGKLVCQSNKLVCVADKTAAAKDTCGNGLDDDCNGKVDDNNCPCTHDLCTEGPGLAAGCTFAVDKDGKNAACHDAVCQEDDYCCDNEWDDTCVKAVQLFCGRLSCEASKGACSHTLCTVGDALTPDCDKGNGTAAVSSCVKKICDVDATCCSEKWDQPCVDRVISVCAKKCDK